MGRESSGETQHNAIRHVVEFSLLLCLIAITVGCGYTYATSRLSPDYQTIAIPAFKNKSFEPDIQIRVTNLLIRELEADGRFRIVDDPAAADLVLRGEITNFDARAISFRTNDNIGQFKVTLIAEAILEDGRTGETLWREKGIRGTDFYQTVGGRTREEALQESSENLVEMIIHRSLDSYW